MTDSTPLTNRVTDLARHISFPLTDRDVDRLVNGTRRRSRQRGVRRVAVASSVCAVSLALGVWWAIAPARTTALSRAARPSVTPPTLARTFRGSVSEAPTRLLDGSLLTPLDAETELTVVGQTPRRIVIDFNRGRVRAEVVPNHDRSFEIRAGEVTVLVLGTVFTVERVADRVGVTVERGTVRVNWGLGHQDVRAGNSGWFPPLQVRSQAVPGDHVGDLLNAADAARVAGRPEDAAILLRRVVRDSSHDPQAPLAAFTMGRVLMLELHRPAEAALAFATARALAPAGPFAEDAMAREVESWAAAGNQTAARRRAHEYLREYPHGRRLDEVRAFGGLP